MSREMDRAADRLRSNRGASLGCWARTRRSRCCGSRRCPYVRDEDGRLGRCADGWRASFCCAPLRRGGSCGAIFGAEFWDRPSLYEGRPSRGGVTLYDTSGAPHYPDTSNSVFPAPSQRRVAGALTRRRRLPPSTPPSTHKRTSRSSAPSRSELWCSSSDQGPGRRCHLVGQLMSLAHRGRPDGFGAVPAGEGRGPVTASVTLPLAWRSRRRPTSRASRRAHR